MIITGIICLCDGQSIIDCKRYVGRTNRDNIISNWIENNYTHDSFIVIPDTEFEPPQSGIISLITNNIRAKCYYHSLTERQKIIDEWVDLYNLNDKQYTLKIIPND